MISELNVLLVHQFFESFQVHEGVSSNHFVQQVVSFDKMPAFFRRHNNELQSKTMNFSFFNKILHFYALLELITADSCERLTILDPYSTTVK